jgi:hypothetical protein
MSHVEVQRICSTWALIVSIDGQVMFTYTDRQLINVIGMASSLQMHIDNLSELPLNQYLTLNEGY